MKVLRRQPVANRRQLCFKFFYTFRVLTMGVTLAEENLSSLFETKHEVNHQTEIDRLHQILGQVTAERNFLERALNHLK